MAGTWNERVNGHDLHGFEGNAITTYAVYNDRGRCVGDFDSYDEAYGACFGVSLEPMVEELTGERGFLATLPNGIGRWATTPERAVEIARRQTEMYERAGILGEVMVELGTA